VAETTSGEPIEKSYQKLLTAAKDGPDAVRKAVEEISPGSPDWIEAAWDVILARQQDHPRFNYSDEETGATVHWPSDEGVLRKTLNAARNTPAPAGCSERAEAS